MEGERAARPRGGDRAGGAVDSGHGAGRARPEGGSAGDPERALRGDSRVEGQSGEERGEAEGPRGAAAPGGAVAELDRRPGERTYEGQRGAVGGGHAGRQRQPAADRPGAAAEPSGGKAVAGRGRARGQGGALFHRHGQPAGDERAVRPAAADDRRDERRRARADALLRLSALQHDRPAEPGAVRLGPDGGELLHAAEKAGEVAGAEQADPADRLQVGEPDRKGDAGVHPRSRAGERRGRLGPPRADAHRRVPGARGHDQSGHHRRPDRRPRRRRGRGSGREEARPGRARAPPSAGHSGFRRGRRRRAPPAEGPARSGQRRRDRRPQAPDRRGRPPQRLRRELCRMAASDPAGGGKAGQPAAHPAGAPGRGHSDRTASRRGAPRGRARES